MHFLGTKLKHLLVLLARPLNYLTDEADAGVFLMAIMVLLAGGAAGIALIIYHSIFN